MFRSNPVLWPKPPVIWSLGLRFSRSLQPDSHPIAGAALEAAPVSLFLFAVHN